MPVRDSAQCRRWRVVRVEQKRDRSDAPARAADLQSLPNLGPKSAGWLAAVGIHNRAELEESGAAAAYLDARDAFPEQVTLNLLYAIQAALMGIDWRDLPGSLKESLIREVHLLDAKDRPLNVRTDRPA